MAKTNRLLLKFNISQLDRIIIALVNNGENKKFASNVQVLFNRFAEESYLNDIEKDSRVYLIKRLSSLIVNKEIKDKNSILAWIDFDGKYANECTNILNNLFEAELSMEELNTLDEAVSNQLRYSYLDGSADHLVDLFTNLKSENYDSLPNMIGEIQTSIDSLSKKLRDSKESLENSKLKVSFSSNTLKGTLSKIIEEERNPATKVKTGIRAMNELLNGGFERG